MGCIDFVFHRLKNQDFGYPDTSLGILLNDIFLFGYCSQVAIDIKYSVIFNPLQFVVAKTRHFQKHPY